MEIINAENFCGVSKVDDLKEDKTVKMIHDPKEASLYGPEQKRST